MLDLRLQQQKHSHKLLVLVELLQILDRLVLEVDELCAVDVGGIGENADGHAGAGDVGEPARVAQGVGNGRAGVGGEMRRGEKYALDGARETLVALGVVVFEANLELDGLDKVSPLLAVGLGEGLLDGAPNT